MEQSVEIRLIASVNEGKLEEGGLEAIDNGGKMLFCDKKLVSAMLPMLIW